MLRHRWTPSEPLGKCCVPLLADTWVCAPSYKTCGFFCPSQVPWHLGLGAERHMEGVLSREITQKQEPQAQTGPAWESGLGLVATDSTLLKEPSCPCPQPCAYLDSRSTSCLNSRLPRGQQGQLQMPHWSEGTPWGPLGDSRPLGAGAMLPAPRSGESRQPAVLAFLPKQPSHIELREQPQNHSGTVRGGVTTTTHLRPKGVLESLAEVPGSLARTGMVTTCASWSLPWNHNSSQAVAMELWSETSGQGHAWPPC